jgi:hypothetical protein
MHLPFLHKLWDRGVDIGVGVTTSVVVAAIGYVFWKLKLRLDLHAEKQRLLQQDRIQKLIDRVDRRAQESARFERQTRELEDIAAVAERTFNRDALKELWGHYRNWVKSEDLLRVPKNLEAFLENTKDPVNSLTPDDHPSGKTERASRVATIIRRTIIPKPDPGGS